MISKDSFSPSTQDKRNIRLLLDRPAPPDYLKEWSDSLAELKDGRPQETESVFLFRLSEEWLALPVFLFQETLNQSSIHFIPHRSHSFLLGLTNVRGELQLCFSLAALLGIDPVKGRGRPLGRRIYSRLLLIEKERQRWVFPVSEVFGVQRIPMADFKEVPVTLSQAAAPLTASVFEFENRTVGLLDEELLFTKLKQDLL